MVLHCCVCYGEVEYRGAWKVAGPEDRYAHPDCHRLAFDQPPAQRCCSLCGRLLEIRFWPLRLVVVRGLRYHSICWLMQAPSAKAGTAVN